MGHAKVRRATVRTEWFDLNTYRDPLSSTKIPEEDIIIYWLFQMSIDVCMMFVMILQHQLEYSLPKSSKGDEKMTLWMSMPQ